MKKYIMKFIIVTIIFSAISVFFLLDLHHYASLEVIKAQQSKWQVYYHNHNAFVVGLFGLIYVLVTALSLPGATVLTLLSGGLFGFSFGLLIVSFASTIGATLAFISARFILREWIQRKYGSYLTKINNGFEKEGSFYVFALRLVPLFPFFLVNLLTALTPIKTWTFYWVSQIGMLAGTAVYVYAGTQLSEVDSLSGIVSPTLLLSFGLIGLLPIFSNKYVAGNWKKTHTPNWALSVLKKFHTWRR